MISTNLCVFTLVHTIDAVAPPCHWIDSTHFFFRSFFYSFAFFSWSIRFLLQTFESVVCSCACVHVCACKRTIVLVLFFVLWLIFLAPLHSLHIGCFRFTQWLCSLPQFNTEHEWNVDQRPKTRARVAHAHNHTILQ